MSLKICHVMLLPLFIIVLKIFLVQSINSAEFNHANDYRKSGVRIPIENAFDESKNPSVKNFVSNKDDVYNTALFVDRLYKDRQSGSFSKTLTTDDTTLIELRNVLSKLLTKQNSYVKVKRHADQVNKRVKNSHDVGTWGKWNEWSPCSVTCGKGREIRWRHCVESCDGVETEMQEKTCQLPDCGRKWFGLINV